ncbi:hypothetical protein ABMA28_009697 [Loxostege sticticalis]|uniref:Uncharacterized protein n=1 Tax=Loxostege sticticalis TaxID=481309 RepID=A0ABD0SB61_LOXSC
MVALSFDYLSCIVSSELSYFVFRSSPPVEARPKEVIPVPGWFNNVEGFVVPVCNVGTVEIIDALKKTKNKKKRKHLVKKGAKKLQKEEGKDKWSVFKLTKKKKKHKSKGNQLKFIKSKVNDNDSGVSQSNEKQPSRKSPVDIVVHIKMND